MYRAAGAGGGDESDGDEDLFAESDDEKTGKKDAAPDSTAAPSPDTATASNTQNSAAPAVNGIPAAAAATGPDDVQAKPGDPSAAGLCSYPALVLQHLCCPVIRLACSHQRI